LIAPDPADDIAGLGAAFSAFANINNHGIGGVIYIGVIQHAKVIDINQKIGSWRAYPLAIRQNLVESSLQAGAVQMTGQAIIIGHSL